MTTSTMMKEGGEDGFFSTFKNIGKDLAEVGSLALQARLVDKIVGPIQPAPVWTGAELKQQSQDQLAAPLYNPNAPSAKQNIDEQGAKGVTNTIKGYFSGLPTWSILLLAASSFLLISMLIVRRD